MLRRHARLSRLALLLFFSLTAAGAAAQTEGEELLPAGTFEAGRLPEGWNAAQGVTVASENGNHWLRVEGGNKQATFTLPIPEGVRCLRLRMRMKTTNVVRGDETWKNARLAMQFTDGQKRVGDWPNVFIAEGTTDWQTCVRDYAVPEGATHLHLGAANFGASGRAEFDDISLRPLTVTPCEKGEVLFSSDFRDGLAGWGHRGGIRVLDDGGNPRMVLAQADSQATVERSFTPNVRKVLLRCRMRLDGVVSGKETWQDARLGITFYDDAGKRVGPWPSLIHGEGSEDWKEYEQTYAVPEGATKVVLQPSHLGTAGVVEFDDIVLTVARIYTNVKADAPLPKEVTEPFSLKNAWREESTTRTSLCLNGLWKFLPVLGETGQQPPADGEGWGWFKVPSVWPNSGDWSTGPAAQQPILSDYVNDRIDLDKLERAWYSREITIPAALAGKSIQLEFTMVQAHAAVWLDSKAVGAVAFPGGVVDLTQHARPGATQRLSVLLTALPLVKESSVFMAQDRVFKEDAKLKMKGLPGDVFLHARPQGETLVDCRFTSSVRDGQVSLSFGIEHFGQGKRSVEVAFSRDGKVEKEIRSPLFTAADLKDGRYAFTAAWADAALWDTHTPENRYTASVTLLDEAGKAVDQSLPSPFAFREFRVEGRDFILNGKPIHLRALHLGNASGMADRASLEGCLATCDRLQEGGFNAAIFGNYDFRAGSVSYIDGLLEAADRKGLLLAFSFPHLSDYGWDLNNPENAARYRELSAWLVRRFAHHPSIVLYAMNHNACGYHGDQNPLKIDGRYDPEAGLTDEAKEKSKRHHADLAAAIVKSLDPTRPIYHHQSGNLGDLHSVNIYLNWAPMQERSEWLEHWATEGQKPVFFVEWGLPHIASWSSYRGPHFIWRTPALQSLWDSEFAAAHIGQEAYRQSEHMQQALRLEEQLFAKGEPFSWSVLSGRWRNDEQSYLSVQARFANENWRAHRTWGVSAMLPWDQGGFWKPNGKTRRIENPGRYANLNRPGIVPDEIHPGRQYVENPTADGFEPTSIGRSMLRWNRPVIAWVGGHRERWSEKSHLFTRGETFEKQLIVVNDARETLNANWTWRIVTSDGREVVPARTEGLLVEAGRVAFTPVQIATADLAPGLYRIDATFAVGTEEEQSDAFEFRVLEPTPKLALRGTVALFDPHGKSTRLLKALGVTAELVTADSELDGYSLLIVGREAVGLDTRLPDLSRVGDGLQVLVLEQTADTLEKRLGFRIQEHGLRNLYVRSALHPALAGISDDCLRDWRGAATLLPPHLEHLARVEETDPKWQWCGMENTRVWRCGNTGNVASVLIEKPSRGSWRALVDGGFDLQYAPLLEYAQGKGRVVFCQLDVSARTADEPMIGRLLGNLLRYLDQPVQMDTRPVFVDGDDKVTSLLDALGIRHQPLTDQTPATDAVVVVGPGAQRLAELPTLAQDGARVLTLGLEQTALETLFPGEVQTTETIPAFVERFDARWTDSISNAELQMRTVFMIPQFKAVSPTSNEFFKVSETGKGVIAVSQVAPWMIDYSEKPYLRTTYRRNLYLVAQLLRNLGATADAPLLALLQEPANLNQVPLARIWKGRVDRNNAGRNERWFTPEVEDADWEDMSVPGSFDRESKELDETYNGLYWYRLRFSVPANFSNEPPVLHLGGIDDESWVWLNGHFLGEITSKTNPKDFYRFPRSYELPEGLLKRDGENVVAVLVNDTYLTGGIKGVPMLKAGTGIWLRSYYIQEPQSGDDPYRYYRW